MKIQAKLILSLFAGALLVNAQQDYIRGYGKLPLSFEVNRGQAECTVKFLARGSGYSLFLSSSEAVLALNGGRASGGGGLTKDAQKPGLGHQVSVPPPAVLH